MRRKKNRNTRYRQKGSALLFSLMVMVGLSLLGLGFVAVSETESAIAVNERNYVQARQAAESGVNAVVEMFQDAEWARDRGILPPNSTDIKTQRLLTGPDTYYKENPTDLLFDIPFKGNDRNKFFGDVATADVIIRWSDGGTDQTYLTTLSNALFFNVAGQNETLRISDIRIYAPPWPGATKNADGFWESTAFPRYGVATVRVTAQKLVAGVVRGERSVTAVIAETPFPTVDGAIETSGSLVGKGNFNVYWGKILSEKDMNVNRPAYGLPWFDAKNFITFEYGYDSTEPRKANTIYRAGHVVNAPENCITANPDLEKLSYRNTLATGGGTTDALGLDTAAECLAIWDANSTVGDEITDGTVKWEVMAARTLRNKGDPDGYTSHNWLYQLVGRTIEDPWLHARARGALTYGNSKIVPCGNGTADYPHPCDYDSVNGDDPLGRYSNFFQYLTNTDTGSRPERIEAVFPTMEYEFWKAVAQSGSNDPDSGIYYFEYAGSVTDTHLNFKGPQGKVKPMIEWMNAAPTSTGEAYNGLLPGFYFFDTKNKKNPQFGKGGVLTPDVELNSGSVTDPKFQMRGYLYMNANGFGSKGIGTTAVTDVYPMPGEPYRDIGFRKVDEDTMEYVLNPLKADGGTLPTADFVIETANIGNKDHDYQDVNHNGQLDIYVADVTENGAYPLTRPDTNTTVGPVYLPVPWFEGCTPPDPLADPVVTGDCSEPHEPFLNLIYPDKGSPKGSVIAGWTNPAAIPVTDWRKPKLRGLTADSTVPCTDASTQTECTSNGYDEDGALVTLETILWGAVYNEGGYIGTGNAVYYGALLVRGDFSGTGTPDVFFNECLARGCLESQLKMQRVSISSMETD